MISLPRGSLTAGLILMTLAVGACGGPHGEDRDDMMERRSAMRGMTPPAGPASQAPDEDDLDEDDLDALAARGRELFAAKACVGCHTIGKGRLTGPDLAGVTDRRARAWIVAMIMRPDSMLKSDATARRLYMQYATPMPNLNTSREEALALYAYLRIAGGAASDAN